MPRVAKKPEVEVAVEEVVAPTKATRKAKAVVVEDDAPQTVTRRTRTKKERDPNAPRRPMNAYILFTKDYRDKHAAELAAVGKTTEQGTFLGQKYAQLKPAEKKRFLDQAAKLKAVYDKEIEVYRQSQTV